MKKIDWEIVRKQFYRSPLCIDQILEKINIPSTTIRRRCEKELGIPFTQFLKQCEYEWKIPITKVDWEDLKQKIASSDKTVLDTLYDLAIDRTCVNNACKRELGITFSQFLRNVGYKTKTTEKKVDWDKVVELIREGFSRKEIAKFFNITANHLSLKCKIERKIYFTHMMGRILKEKNSGKTRK